MSRRTAIKDRGLMATTRLGIDAGRTWFESIPYRGWGRFCPVCGRSSRQFLPHGSPPRAEAKCVHCGSLERHRFAWKYLHEQTDLLDGREKTVLHFAPERCFEPRFRAALGAGYVTADLTRKNVDMTVDVTDIPYPDGTLDVIICSHVLEHVPDDLLAMRELVRVLADDGWALLMVPVKGRSTHEDPNIVDPEDRIREFGQADHVRWYGIDIVDRLEKTGFSVTQVRAGSFLKPQEMRHLGVNSEGRKLFMCRKAVA